MNWREAATLLLLRPLTKTARQRCLKPENLSINAAVLANLQRLQQQHDYEIHVGVRSAKMKFYGSSLAFPGGAIDQEDCDPQWWNNLIPAEKNVIIPASCSKVPLPLYERKRSFAAGFKPFDSRLAFRLCAIRELAEETGLILSYRDSGNRPEASDVKSPNFGDVLRKMGRYPAVDKLYDWRCWLTPKFYGNKRFDTIFYIAFLDDENLQLSQLKQQKHFDEMKSLRWATVPELMADFLAGKLSLPPPQLHELSTLLRYPSFSQLKDFVSTEMQPNEIQRFLPIRARFSVGTNKSSVLLLPGDSCYPTDNKAALEMDEVFIERETLEENLWSSKTLHRVMHDANDVGRDGQPKLKLICSFDRFKTGQLAPSTNFEH